MNGTFGFNISHSTSDNWDRVVRSSWHPTLSINLWGFIISILTILFQAAAVGLFKLWRVGLFSLLPETVSGWMTDQLRVAIVNRPNPLEVLWCTPALRSAFVGLFKGGSTQRLERTISWLWLVGALILALLPLATSPLITSAVPYVSGLPGSTDDCAAGVTFLPAPGDTTGQSHSQYYTLAALDWLRAVDTSNFNYSATSAESIGLPRRGDTVAVSSVCPDWAPVYDQNNPLRVDMGFSVQPSDLGIGVASISSAAEFGVRHTVSNFELRVTSRPIFFLFLCKVFLYVQSRHPLSGTSLRPEACAVVW
jgi:hypothetical protein